MTTHLPSSQLPRRPRLWMALSAALAIVSAGAAIMAALRPAALAAPISLSAPLEILAGALWALAFAWLSLRLWRREARAQPVFGWALIAWIGYSLVRAFVYVRADYDRARLPFLVAASLVACALILFFVIRPRHTGAIHTETVKHDQPKD